MNALTKHLVDNPSHSHSDVQTFEYKDETFKVGSGAARGWFVENDIWRQLKTFQADIAHPLFSLADAIIVTASDASSFFGVDASTSVGRSNIAGAAALAGHGVMTSDQVHEFLNKSIKVSIPFLNVTQPEFDAAKAEIALIGELASHTTYYNDVSQHDMDKPKIIKGNSETLCINISYDDVLPVATTGRLMSISFPKGGKTRQHKIGTTNRERVFARKTQYWFVSDVNLPSQVTAKVG